MAKTDIIIHDKKDNVGVIVIEKVTKGQDCGCWIMEDDSSSKVKSEAEIPLGHKIALKQINKGEKIIKYDQIIGLAEKDISPGEHVHTDNTEFRFSDHDYEFSTSVKLPNFIPEKERPLFNGYKLSLIHI